LSGKTAQSISIFDLDRTLTRNGTWTPFLMFAARRLVPWRLLLAPAGLCLMLAYKAGVISRKRLKETMHALLLGRSIRKVRINAIAGAFADQLVARGLYPEAIGFIRSEQANGRRVIIASAAHRFYLDAIAHRIGVTEVVGTNSHWQNDCLGSAIAGENCYGEFKKAMILSYFDECSIDRTGCSIRFFSDDLSDLPTLNWADEAIAVNPSRKLARHAVAAGWAILDWRQKARFTNKPTRASRRLGVKPAKTASR
jgi:HAD superfamily hydrolase (TIGR01490 family)